MLMNAHKIISDLSVCILCGAGVAMSRLSMPSEDQARLTILQQRISRLESAVQQAEAIRAVKRLQHAYGHYAEQGLWHDFADLPIDKTLSDGSGDPSSHASCYSPC